MSRLYLLRSQLTTRELKQEGVGGRNNMTGVGENGGNLQTSLEGGILFSQ